VVANPELMSTYKSPHIARWLAGERIADDVMVFGNPRLSKVLTKPLPFNRELASRLSLKIQFPKGRTESQTIGLATRQWRELTNQDAEILQNAITICDRATEDSDVAYWFMNTDNGTLRANNE